MAIKNLGSKISSDDLDAIDSKENPPEYEPGFDGSLDDFDSLSDESLFGDFSDSGGGIFGDSSSGGSSEFNLQGNGSILGDFSGNNQSNGLNNQGVLGSNGNNGGVLGQNTLGMNGQNNGMLLGQNNGQPRSKTVTEQAAEKFTDASITSSKELASVFKCFISSIKSKTAQDIGYVATDTLKMGGILFGASFITSLLFWLMDIKLMSFGGLPLGFMKAGLATVGFGLIGMGTSAIAVSFTSGESGNINMDQVPDASTTLGIDDALEDIEDSAGSQFDSLFSSDDLFDELDDLGESDFDDILDMNNSTDTEDDNDSFLPNEEVDISNLEKAFESIKENQLITRETLVNTFVPLLPINTPGFADTKLLESGEDFAGLKGCIIKAISNVARKSISELDLKVVSIEESFFSYCIIATRVKGLTKVDEIAREVEIYLRENSEDVSVNAKVSMEGDNYKIIVTKGVKAVVTIGDMFKQAYVKEFYLNKKNKLPIIEGVDELGRVHLADAKPYDTMLVAGKPRSGKSWYVLSLLMSLMMFNSPEDVQFVIIDPKESNLFKTLSLMPHVAGLHNNKKIIALLDDIINNEAPRRKKMFSDNNVEDIWELREKGILLPILYIVIDEYITVRNDLGDDYKELDRRLQVLISQLPSQGIRLIFVPHRATGIVDKTNRTMVQFAAAVRLSPEEVADTLDIKSWSRPLVNPGDTAIKSSATPTAAFVRGAALTTSDAGNRDFIRNLAKAFYKMGVQVPDMSTLGMAWNRNPDKIKRELSSDGSLEQFTADALKSELDSI